MYHHCLKSKSCQAINFLDFPTQLGLGRGRGCQGGARAGTGNGEPRSPCAGWAGAQSQGSTPQTNEEAGQTQRSWPGPSKGPANKTVSWRWGGSEAQPGCQASGRHGPGMVGQGHGHGDGLRLGWDGGPQVGPAWWGPWPGRAGLG